MPYSSGKSKENTVSSKRSTRRPTEVKIANTAIQVHRIDRLKWYLALKEQCKRDSSCEEWQLKMVDRAIYSTFRDCEEQGLVDEAKALLQMSHENN